MTQQTSVRSLHTSELAEVATALYRALRDGLSGDARQQVLDEAAAVLATEGLIEPEPPESDHDERINLPLSWIEYASEVNRRTLIQHELAAHRTERHCWESFRCATCGNLLVYVTYVSRLEPFVPWRGYAFVVCETCRRAMEVR